MSDCLVSTIADFFNKLVLNEAGQHLLDVGVALADDACQLCRSHRGAMIRQCLVHRFALCGGAVEELQFGVNGMASKVVIPDKVEPVNIKDISVRKSDN